MKGAVPESDNQSLVGRPIAAVRADDLKRVWDFLSVIGPGVGVNRKLLADLCDADANVFDVWVRASLATALIEQGRLDGWREENNLRESVFELAARFPLPHGLANFDPDTFVAALKID